MNTAGLKALPMLALWRAVSSMPDRMAYRTMEGIFSMQARRGGTQVQRVRAALEPIVPAEGLDDAVRDAFRWYGRYWAETFRLSNLSSETLTERFRCHGCENIEGALADGKGAVLATLHQGNWDAGARWVAERWPLVAVVEVLQPRALFDRFLEHRRKMGLVIEPLERGVDITGRCIEHVQANRLVALLSDRDLTGSGIPVQFFGRTAKMAAGSAVIAARTGAPILPAVIYQRNDGTFDAHVEAAVLPPADDSPAEIAACTQRVADAFERFVAAEPTQWHMFQRFWPQVES